MLYLKLFLVAISSSIIYSYDKNLMIKDLSGCKELLLEGDYVEDVYPIATLENNHARENEILRMKFFVLGKDMHVRLNHEDDFNMKHYLAYFHGNGGSSDTYKSGIAITDLATNSWNLLNVTETHYLTDRFYYTMLHLVVTEDGSISIYKDPNDLFLSVQVNELSFPRFLSFSRSKFEENSRIFFDCPGEESSEQFKYYTDRAIMDFYAMHTNSYTTVSKAVGLSPEIISCFMITLYFILNK